MSKKNNHPFFCTKKRTRKTAWDIQIRMSNIRLMTLLGMCTVFFILTGCGTKDLSTGRTFSEFQKPPEDKAVVYFVRDDNFMAAKPPYMFIRAIGVTPVQTEAPPKEKFLPVGYVGKNMFVPILVTPGDYYFRHSFSSERMSIKKGDVICVDVGAKYRGITIYVTERIENIEDCKKLLTAGMFEGVQYKEARQRIYSSHSGITPEEANAQIVFSQKCNDTKDQIPSNGE